MIDEYTTFLAYGYKSDDLSKYSMKKVWSICDECGYSRWVYFQAYRDLCLQCSYKKEDRGEKISKSLKGIKRSEKTLKLMSDVQKGHITSVETCKKMSESLKNPSNKTLKKMSENPHKHHVAYDFHNRNALTIIISHSQHAKIHSATVDDTIPGYFKKRNVYSLID